MAKAPITLEILNNALKPLKDAIDAMKNNVGILNEQQNEINTLVMNISTKVDLLDQKSSAVAEAPKPAKKAPAKKTAKKATAKAEEPEETEEAEEKTTKKAVKKAPAKKGKASEEDEEEAEEEAEEPVEETKAKPKGKRVAKPASEAKTRPVNKMEYFNKMFMADNDYFKEFITDEVKQSIDEEHADAWKDFSGEILLKKKCSAYYQYMKDNHDEDLVKMRLEFITPK